VQGLCLPFRGFSRSGATISTGLLLGLDKVRSEEFSFALAVVLTPAVILREGYRPFRAHDLLVANGTDLLSLTGPSVLGMALSFVAGLVALKWLSRWLNMTAGISSAITALAPLARSLSQTRCCAKRNAVQVSCNARRSLSIRWHALVFGRRWGCRCGRLVWQNREFLGLRRDFNWNAFGRRSLVRGQRYDPRHCDQEGDHQ
jgi:hypothetical protein